MEDSEPGNKDINVGTAKYLKEDELNLVIAAG